MAQPQPQPLDNEDILVTVTMTHKQTGTVGVGECAAPADAWPTLTDATSYAARHASDDLLAKLEVQGG